MTPDITANADKKVTVIQLNPEKGPRSIRRSPAFVFTLTSGATMMLLQYFAMHLHHPCEVLATCFFQASRVEGSSLIILTLLRYIPRFPARYIFIETSPSSAIRSLDHCPTPLRSFVLTRANPPWKEKGASMRYAPIFDRVSPMS